MTRTLKRFVSMSMVVCYMMAAVHESQAEPLAVKLTFSPEKTEFYAGQKTVIILTAKAAGTNLTFEWTLNGPGTLEGKGSAVSYTIPNNVGTRSTVSITVTVTDEAGQKIQKVVTFTILPPIKAKTSSVKYIALGAGAVAALGGGIALAANKSSDTGNTENFPFTGTFRTEYDTGTSGASWHWVNVLSLIQNENSLTGNEISTFACPTGCSASFNVSVTGTVSVPGQIAMLTFSFGEATCQNPGQQQFCRGYEELHSVKAELIDNNTLRIEGNPTTVYTRE